MDSNERIKEVCQKIIKVKTALQDLESSVDAVHLLLSADHSMWLLQSEFDDLKKENAKLKINIQAADDRWKSTQQLLENERNKNQGLEAQLAEKEKEIGGLKKDVAGLHRDRAKDEEKIAGLNFQLAEKEKKIEELRKNFAEIQIWYEQRDGRVKSLEENIEKAIIALDQTKKIFKSKTIAQIREKLIDALPIDKQTKFICLGCSVKRE